MPFTIDKLPDVPILLFVQSGSRAAAEAERALTSLTRALDAQPEPVFLILDLRALSISLDELTRTASAVANRPGAQLHHPNLRESLLITNDGLLRLAVYGLRSAAFGGVTIRPFSTEEDAFDYCCDQIAATPRSGIRQARSG